MARPPATPEQRREARNTIRVAAADLVTEGGPSSVTVRKVAERAGVSVGTVYGHFESLSDLLRSLWTPVIAQTEHKLAATAKAHTDPLERIRAMLDDYVELATTNPILHRNTLLFVRPATSKSPEKVPADELELHRLLVEAIREGQGAGTIVDGEPAQLAQLLWAGVHGALALPVNTDLYELEPAAKQAQLMIDMLLRSLQP